MKSLMRIVINIVTIAPLGAILAAVNISALAQTADGAISSAASASTTSSPADWTEFHRNNMQRWNPYETVLGVDNIGSLRVKWMNPIGSLIESSPTVANETVYFGSDDGTVYALDASTGGKRWSYTVIGAPPFFGPVIGSLAVANGAAYFGSYDGNVHALNASTGAMLWSYQTDEGEMRSSATVANGVVYIEKDALNASTGTLLWRNIDVGYVSTSPAVSNGVVYLGSSDQNVYALNASTGAKLWSYATGGSVESSPAVANGVVYIGSTDNNVYALNASTGAKLWSYATGAPVESSPAVANEVVYVGSMDNHVYALNASTGAKLWSYTTGGPLHDASPAVANGVVYITSTDGDIYALNARTGARLWSYSTGASVESSPAVVDGVLYVCSGHTTYAFSVGADLFLRIRPTPDTVHQGDLLTYAFPVWNLGPDNAVHEVLNTQVPEGTTLDYIRISGTPGLGTCTAPPYQGTGKIVCYENSAMAPNTTWTVRVTVKVTAPPGTVITENAATMADTSDPNLANNMATVSLTVQ